MAPIIQTCGRCGKEVYHAEKKIALNKVWHDFCFSCVICQKRLSSQNINSHRGELFCRACYAQIITHETDFDSHQSSRARNFSSSSSTVSRNSSVEFFRPARAEIVEISNLRPSEIKNAVRSRRKESLSVDNEDRSSQERRRTCEDSRPPQYYNRQRRNAICGMATVQKEFNTPPDKNPNEESFHKIAKDLCKIPPFVRQERQKLFTEEDSAYETETQNIYKNILPSYLCKGDVGTCPRNAVYSELIYENSLSKIKDDNLHKLKDKTHKKLITDTEKLYESHTPEEKEEILFISESGTTKIVKKTCPKKGKYKEMSHTTVLDDKSVKKYNIHEDSDSSLHRKTVKYFAKETKNMSQRNDKETVKILLDKKETDESNKNRKKTMSSNKEIQTKSQKGPKSSKRPQRNTKENVQETPVPNSVKKTSKIEEKYWFLPKFNLFNRKNYESNDKLNVIEEKDEYLSRNSGETRRFISKSSDSILTERRRESIKNSSLDSRYKPKSHNSREDINETTSKNIRNKYSQETKDKSRRKSKLRTTSSAKSYISPAIKQKLRVYETVKDSDSFIQKSMLKKKHKSSNLNEEAQNVTRENKTPQKDQKHTKESKDTNKLCKNIETSKIKDEKHTKKTSKQITSKEKTEHDSLDANILKPNRYSTERNAQNGTKKNKDHTPKNNTSKKDSSNILQGPSKQKQNIFKRIPKIKSDKELFTTVYNIYPDSKEDVKTCIQSVRTPKKSTNFNNEDRYKRLQTSKHKNSLALNSDRKKISSKEDIDDLQVGRFVVTTEISPKTNKKKIRQASGDNTTKKRTMLSKTDSTKIKRNAEVLPTKCVTKACNKVTKKQSVDESNNLCYSNKKYVANIKKTKTPKTALNEDISQSKITKRILSTYASKCDRDKEENKEKLVEKLRKKRFFEPVRPRAKSGASNMVVHPLQEPALDTHELLFKRSTRDCARDYYPNFGIWSKKHFVPKKEKEISRKYICKRCDKNVFAVERVCADNEVFHKSCFSCYICNKYLDSLNVLPRQGEVYCKQCYMKFFGPHTYGFGLCPNLYN